VVGRHHILKNAVREGAVESGALVLISEHNASRLAAGASVSV
jgi:hypothetical protein